MDTKTTTNSKLNTDMDSGTYEVIKKRLESQGEELITRVDKLNTVRKDIFGAIETKLVKSERIITEHNCVPRDMAPVEDCFVFGYNVHMGLKSKVELDDVFSVYRYSAEGFQRQSLALLDDPQFSKDFDDLYKYYKDTYFAKFTILGPYFYMVFQVSKNPEDIKVFKWHMSGERLTYVDKRSEHEVKFDTSDAFDFIQVTRDHQKSGIHPHVSILDQVFVETIGGDLTIKIEDNTDTGKGIYSEDVVDKDQTLDDAYIAYADLGQLIVLKILPYKEQVYRYFVFNKKLKNVVRIDSIKDTCLKLPDDHGLIFPKGYYLQNGEYKLFDVPCDHTVFDQMISSVNGEDYQYIFYNLDTGIYLIYTYNVIEQTIETPIVCSGYSHFKNGEMVVFRHENEPRKNHMVQVWQTPYVDKDYQQINKQDSVLSNIGNQDIVNCMAACRVVARLIGKGGSYQSVYVDIVKESQHIIDSYFWIGKDEAFNLDVTLKAIRETSSFAIDEFEKVIRIKSASEKQFSEVQEATEHLLKTLKYGAFETVNEYVDILADIRKLRGRIVSLRDLRYTDIELVDALDEKVKEQNDLFSVKCVDFLVQPEGLKPYEIKVNGLIEKIQDVNKSSDGKLLDEEMNQASLDLELLMDIVSNFKIEDPTITTQIIDKISELFSLLNNAKAKLKSKVEAFTIREMDVQFGAQMKLLGQAVVNYLEVSDTEEKCQQYLNKVLVQIQELEGKFAEFEDYIRQLDEKREEIYNAFETKKQAIIDRLNKRMISLFDSAERVISGIAGRLKHFDTVEEINGYMATDIMVEKVRDIIIQLRQLGDQVKADEISSKLKSLKEDILQQLKDKQELYVDGDNVIKLGQHKFSVNTKEIDLSMVQKEDGLYYHITGTDFWDPVVNEEIREYEHVYDQRILSENKDVYRSEYLAYLLFDEARKTGKSLKELTEQQLSETIKAFMEPRYQEGYVKGVHDVDASKILLELIRLHKGIDLLTFSGVIRAKARLFWQHMVDEPSKTLIENRLQHLNAVQKHFETTPDLKHYVPYVKEQMETAFATCSLYEAIDTVNAADYLCRELMTDTTFAVSHTSYALYEAFTGYLKQKKASTVFETSIKASQQDIEGLYFLVNAWIRHYCEEVAFHEKEFNNLKEDTSGIIEEVILMIMDQGTDMNRIIEMDTSLKVSGLVGSHGVIQDGQYSISYTAFMEKLNHFDKSVVKDFERFQEIKKTMIDGVKESLHLDDFKPRVLTSFVRNQLIDQVYLPLIGDNLAKQMGVVGDNKRTDLMGMLMLVSPPGYGKTTLMEYIASRLGIILVKINGPSLGNEVTSLDPEKASHSSAKEELRKLNLALKMGNNVMIYVDDIQHCHPEFLQKFISLCDGQRKIEGVYNGKAQTFDLRGKKVVVVMSGNPYTESGEKFKIPDMLSNRADVYNLGDMLRENEEAFKLSYIENSLTSNVILRKLANKNPKDLYGLVDMANGAAREDVTFESEFTLDEMNEYIEVLKKLMGVRDIILKVNMAYIYSAAQADAYRNEPPFKLQGSYRNMNRIAEKIVAVMNDDEVFGQILASYENDCQTLTTDSEANILMWKELVGCLTDQEQKRLDEIKHIFMKGKMVKGDDKMGQAVLALSNMTDALSDIRQVLATEK